MSKYGELVDFTKSVDNVGDVSRIVEVMKRGLRGERLTVGFIGGSITNGSLATDPTRCYAYLVYKWWRENFSASDIKYVNAGIGGTCSQFGVARADEDLLNNEPDFVIVEFSVNDDNNEHYMETYEGLVRKVLTHPNKPALMLLHNAFYDDGRSALPVHRKIATNYELPSVSINETIIEAVLSGRIDNRSITPDNLHPNDEGHELLSKVVTYYLDKIKEATIKIVESEGAVENDGEDSDNEACYLASPITPNMYEDSVRYNNKNSNPLCDGFVADLSEQKDLTDCFKNGWTACKIGDRIVFEVEGSCIGIQYKKTINKPAPVAKAMIDGKVEVVLDANFDETWGDKLVLATALEHGNCKKHVVEIEIIEAHDDDRTEFMLVSVIGSGR